jgi:hypothetical protein
VDSAGAKGCKAWTVQDQDANPSRPQPVSQPQSRGSALPAPSRQGLADGGSQIDWLVHDTLAAIPDQATTHLSVCWFHRERSSLRLEPGYRRIRTRPCDARPSTGSSRRGRRSCARPTIQWFVLKAMSFSRILVTKALMSVQNTGCSVLFVQKSINPRMAILPLS